ncbi:MAG: DMT family transporter [Nitriliruptorales bacterium]
MTIPVLVALGIGAAIAIQAVAISSLTGAVHPLAISLSLLVSGLVVGIGWATVHGAWPEVLVVARQWWWLPLGAAGWAIVAALGWTVARLGAAAGLSLIVAAQLTAALVIDAGRGHALVGPRSLAGAALLVVGAALLGSAQAGGGTTGT